MRELILFIYIFSFWKTDTPGAFVRITREQQATIDNESVQNALTTRTAGVVPKRSRKRQATLLPSDEDLENDPVPQTMRLNVSMMRRLMAKHDDATIAQRSVSETKARAERLEKVWCDLNAGWDALAGRTMSRADLETCSEFFGQITEEYLRFKAKLCDSIGQSEYSLSNNMATGLPPAAVTTGGQFLRIQLTEPPKVPKFSGNEVDWANFRTMFEATVHKNPQLSNTQKMQHLLDALEGRAAKAYGNWPIMSDASYEILWSEMCGQYSNEYNTVRAHLQALSALKPMQQPTSEAMRQIIDVARGSFRQLQLLLRPDQMAEYMLLHQLENLLDAEGRTQWNLRRATDSLPTLQQMFTFMQLRASMLDAPGVTPMKTETRNEQRRNERMGDGTNLAAQRGKSVGRGDEQRPVCDLCPGQMHWPFKCWKFKAKSITERLDYVTMRRMCANCFSFKHVAKACPDKGCPRCKKNHNSCLCPANVNIDGSSTPMERMQQTTMPKKAAAAQGATSTTQ